MIQETEKRLLRVDACVDQHVDHTWINMLTMGQHVDPHGDLQFPCSSVGVFPSFLWRFARGGVRGGPRRAPPLREAQFSKVPSAGGSIGLEILGFRVIRVIRVQR